MYHQRGNSGATSQPPDYTSQAGYNQTRGEYWDPAPYDAKPLYDRMPGRDQTDSSRSIANGDQAPAPSRYLSSHETRKLAALNSAAAAAGAAGIGANSNAYRLDPLSSPAADSPSMYTDPYEFQSTAPPPNVMSTRPPNSFLDSDPFASNDRPLGGTTDLSRSDTLAPHDSISSYNVRLDDTTRNTRQNAYSENESLHYSANHAPYASGYTAGDRGTSFDERDYYNYSQHPYDTSGVDLPLKHHAGQMGYAEDEDDEAKQMKRGSAALFSNQMGATTAPDEESRDGLLTRFMGRDGHPSSADEKLQQKIERRKKGIGRQRWPFVSYIMGVALVIVFIIELIKANSETGQAVQTRPSINPMLGPSSEFLISFGARFVPCMRDVPEFPPSTQLPCLKASTSSSSTLTEDQLCPVSEICGLKDANSPNQSYRFISPMFVHAGFVHIIFNLLVLLTLCAQIEKILGSIPYTIIYFAGGIGGNLLGGNFGLIGQPALGASGAIYTCISVELVDLVYNWQYEYRAKTRLIMSIVFAIIGLALGLLPGLDNFSHIGGFCVGLLGGLLFCPSIHPTRRHRTITWILRIAALGLLIGFFVGLATNFYNNPDPSKACTWCRYLSCLPVFNSCKNNGLTTTTVTTTGGN